VKIIRQRSNSGPAKNRNIAIKRGNSPYIAIFDDDTFLDDTTWLEKAITKMKENPDIAEEMRRCLISHVFPAEEIEKAFQCAAGKEVVKVVVTHY
jgi:glycosyltransferase involved in cell wall biosynthesis